RMEKWAQTSLVIFWLQLSWVSSEDKVVQSPPSLVVHEGNSATLNCSYEMANFQSLHWYKQEEKAPTFLFILVSSGMKKNGRMSATISTKESQSSLHIEASQPRDSATYLCAVGHSAPQAPAAHTQTPQLKPPFLLLSVSILEQLMEVFKIFLNNNAFPF
uniref:Ig-like domain-containing protein n=1 Tax=Spermophilus dauricus TaxID=99837 RepID=A0A8C9Q945_SPEDA